MSDERIIVFSDVHLGHSTCNRAAFAKFVHWLARETPDRVVILGDLLDFWRRSNAEVLLENKEVLRELFGLSCRRICYVPGNHDYAIYDTATRAQLEREIAGDLIVAKRLRLQCCDHTYHLTHGYDLDVAVTMEYLPLDTYEAFAAAMCRADDTLGGVASLLWDAVTIAGGSLNTLRQICTGKHSDKDWGMISNVAKSGTAHLLCGAHPRDRIVFGHTHWPFCTLDQRVANTGSWCTENGIPQHNTYVEITQEGMELKNFE